MKLNCNAIHICRAYLSDLKKWKDHCFRILSSDEKDRAGRFKTADLQKRFIIWRGTLRTLLGSYLSISPEDVRLSYGNYGKPYIDLPQVNKTLYFNLSHSHQYALFVFAETRVGIDIEYMDLRIPSNDLVMQNFSPSEIEIFFELPDDLKVEAFFNCWTRKEAFIKAVGEGLSYPLKDFDVTLKPGNPARLIEIRRSGMSASEWNLYDIDVEKGYKAALAVYGHPTQILYHNVANLKLGPI